MSAAGHFAPPRRASPSLFGQGRFHVLGDVVHVQRLERGEGPLHVEELEDRRVADAHNERTFARLLRIDDDVGLARERLDEFIGPRLERASALAGLD